MSRLDRPEEAFGAEWNDVDLTARVLMIDRTYGHLAHDAEEHDRLMQEALDATDRARGHVMGTESGERAEGEDAPSVTARTGLK